MSKLVSWMEKCCHIEIVGCEATKLKKNSNSSSFMLHTINKLSPCKCKNVRQVLIQSSRFYAILCAQETFVIYFFCACFALLSVNIFLLCYTKFHFPNSSFLATTALTVFRYLLFVSHSPWLSPLTFFPVPQCIRRMKGMLFFIWNFKLKSFPAESLLWIFNFEKLRVR